METLSKPVTKKPGRRVMVTPNRYALYTALPGKKTQPATQLGLVAQNLAQQSAITVLSVAATSAYVYALTQSSAPKIEFTDVPPGMNSSLLQLQTAYEDFLSRFNIFQGQAGAWINTQQNTGTASIFSQLVSVPTTLLNINNTVSSNFSLLNALTPGSSEYNNILGQQELLIGAETPAITGLVSSMQLLGTNLQNAAAALIESTQTGTLSQLISAYQADISTLNGAIDSANQQISSDNAKIIWEGIGAATSLTVGLVGLVNIWNPIGWFLLAGGATGGYFAIVEIEFLKAQIARLKTQIQTDTNYLNDDQQGASTISAFCTQLQGFASLNQAAQQELITLENLYNNLNTDITNALNDLDGNELTAAQTEWTTILQEAQVLANLTAYLWPSPALLSAPASFAAIGNDIYCISLSGEMFHFNGSNSTWTDMGVKALSCAGWGATLVAIDGAPINGTAVSPNPTISTYYVKSYDPSTQQWTIISTFPAAAVAAGANGVFAISQVTNDRQVYQYTGSGANWTPLPALPGPDAATQVAVAGGTVFALTNNSQLVYQYNASTSGWVPVGNFTCCRIVSNANKLALLGTDNKLYLYDASAGGAPLNTCTATIQVAQLSNGNQYGVDTNMALSLIEPSTPISYTILAQNVTGVFAGDTNEVYFTDNTGNLYSINASGTPTLLPAMPAL